MGMVDGHGALGKDLTGRVRASKWGWPRAMGPLRMKKIVAGRVKVFMWGWSMAMGPLGKI